jgi:tetratricopeptide (TPR) repeat protein
MTTWKLIAIPIAILAIAAVAFGVHLNRRRNPDVLLQMLRAGKGDQKELMMRLQLLRGDAVTSMIEHVTDSSAPEPFRVEIIRALWRTYQRTPEERIEETMHTLRKNEIPAIRREAFRGFSTYADDKQKLLLLDHLTDPDDEVRELAYSLFVIVWDSPYNAHKGIWAELSDEQRTSMIETAKEAAPREADEYRNYLARAVVGREIEFLCHSAKQARESGELDRAEQLIRQALALDPDHHRVKIHLARYYLALGDRKRALKEAAKHKALVTINELSSAPVIDGDPTDPVWREGFHGNRFFKNFISWAPREAVSKSEFRIGHYGGKIYVTVVAYDDELDKLRVRGKERDSGLINEDDHVLVLFDPGVSDQNGYVLWVNPANVQRDNYKRNDKHNVNYRTGAGVFKERGYWAAEYEIEIKELQSEGVSDGDVWGMNVQRARMGAASESSQWWPTFPWMYRFETWPLAVFRMGSSES